MLVVVFCSVVVVWGEEVVVTGMRQICIRGAGRGTIRTERVVRSLVSGINVAKLRSLHLVGECSTRKLDSRRFRGTSELVLSRPGLSGICNRVGVPTS